MKAYPSILSCSGQTFRENEIPGITFEGVVGKAKDGRHDLIMAKAKTKLWIEKVRATSCGKKFQIRNLVYIRRMAWDENTGSPNGGFWFFL